MAHTLHNIGVSARIGTYSDAAEIAAKHDQMTEYERTLEEVAQRLESNVQT